MSEKENLEGGPHYGRWCPDICPITLDPFFTWIEHPETGQIVPTYGGPYNSHTIPEPVDLEEGKLRIDIEYVYYDYDHDIGGWNVDSVHDSGLRVVGEETLINLNAWGDE